MIGSILVSRQPVLKRIKKMAFYFSLKRGAKRTWKKKHEALFSKFPDFNRPLDPSVQQTHREIWEPFNRDFDDSTLKICWALSGTADPRIIPEEIFRADIEPTLNCFPEAKFQAHKSFYNRWFKKGIFPEDLLHIINGEILDSEYNSLTLQQTDEFCSTFTYPVVVKPNKDSYGGRGVRFVESAETLQKIIRQKNNVVIQKKIRQHPELAKYHDNSLNTVRVYLYKSVLDNQFYILGMLPRMGNGGPLDNISSGGLASYISEQGKLPGYALGHSMNKYLEHPISGVPFTDLIPDCKGLKKLSLEVAQKLFLIRIVGLDLCYDITGRWRVIEINTTGHTIRSIQYFGKPFFGEFTGEVIEYCKRNHWAKKVKTI